ncbi:hypothetical protein FA95DRAFT_1607436 [Auriscalpium vulgare]|uniref:Uncharacterized protein n=1 Tax=Auriscalpium vulgare TaxID=40419 RepID=A0ACB8RPJ3_9AGAM|nr:hypothetical protein FA95DRAFT_1607436 [Auriscalpium vulgare]
MTLLDRLRGIASHVTPASAQKDLKHKEKEKAGGEKRLPTYDELPAFRNFPGCAWEVWGKGDQLGTVNLLTDEVVKRAAHEEIRTGKAVSLNWPINFPEKPLFGRQTPHVESHWRRGDIRDDTIYINTQSGSQWDGLKHFPILEHRVTYQGIEVDKLPVGHVAFPDPQSIDPELIKLGIHNWAQHGICGRGVLLDLVRYHTKGGAVKLPYDPWSSYGVTVAELEACAREQGVTFRRGDILLLRVGFIQKYLTVDQAERDALPGKPEAYPGIVQGEDMKRFLWNNHFAAVAGDQPALECFPPAEGVPHLHQTLLGLWGMPIGEFFDIEELAKTCAETGRYTFFFSSWPLNVLGGVASPPNAAAYF